MTPHLLLRSDPGYTRPSSRAVLAAHLAVLPGFAATPGGFVLSDGASWRIELAADRVDPSGEPIPGAAGSDGADEINRVLLTLVPLTEGGVGGECLRTASAIAAVLDWELVGIQSGEVIVPASGKHRWWEF